MKVKLSPEEEKKFRQEIECEKTFSCLKKNIAEICRAKDINLKSFLECLEEDPFDCLFSTPFGNKHFCSCGLRKYIQENYSHLLPDQKTEKN